MPPGWRPPPPMTRWASRDSYASTAHHQIPTKGLYPPDSGRKLPHGLPLRWPESPQGLTEPMALLRNFYAFIRPHSSLKLGRVKRTPARQAEIFPRALAFREIFTWVPPPRPIYAQGQAWGRSR